MPAISADGRHVVFHSIASNLAAGQLSGGRGTNVYLWDRTTGRIDLVSRKAGRPQVPGNGGAIEPPAVSANGAFVAFVSEARDLIPRQSGSGRNLFLWERATGKTTLVTRAASSPNQAAGGRPAIGGLSADGNWLLFDSAAQGLVPRQQDGNGRASDVFLWSRRAGTSRLLSGREGSPFLTADGGSVTYADSKARGLSADGAWAVFASVAADLVPGTAHTSRYHFHVYLWSRSTGEATLLSHAADSNLATANEDALWPRISADGGWITYISSATDLDAGTEDTNGTLDVILQSRTGNPKIVSRHAGDL